MKKSKQSRFEIKENPIIAEKAKFEDLRKLLAKCTPASPKPEMKNKTKTGEVNTSKSSGQDLRIQDLEHELESIRIILQGIIDAKKAAEELQSLNEKITALNGELQKRNTELRELNDDHINLINSTNMPIIMLGSDLRIRRFTPAAGIILRLFQSDVGRLISDFKSDVDFSNFEALMFDVMRSGAFKEQETQDAKGQWYKLQIRPYKTSENRIDGVLIEFIDIQDFKEKQEMSNKILDAEIKTRKRVEKDYETLFKNMRSGFILCDIVCDGQGDPIDWRYVSVNPAFEKLTGLKPEHVIGRTVSEVLPHVEQHWIETFGKVALTGETVYFEKYSTELKKHFEVTAFQPAPNQFACLFRDITPRMQNESQVALLRHELAHITRVVRMNELSSSLAHEINQPLGAILNNASAAKILMSQDKDIRKDICEILTDIISDAGRASETILKVKEIIRKSDVKFEILDVNVLINEVIKIYHNSVILNNVALNLDLQYGLAKIKGDRVLLLQVLLNLVNNALDAMEEKPTRILIIRSFMQTPDMVVISVSDSGVGIHDSMKDKLFEPFITSKKDGLGVGLSICKSIIEEHGGRIWEENNPATGATFSISIKAYREESTWALPKR